MRRFGITLAVSLLCLPTFAAEQSPQPGWRAGVSRAKITPQTPLWLAGYGGRTHPAEGTMHDLWVKAMWLEDAQGKAVVLVTTDLCGIPKWMYDKLCDEFSQKYGVDRSQIRLTYSHNHCAPALRGELEDYYSMDEQQRGAVSVYSDWLEREIALAVAEAKSKMQPATLEAFEGQCTFAVNRRNNREAEIPEILAKGQTPKGPVDHRVPVLRVSTPDGKPIAIVFAYACHNTTLDSYQWCGDYAGFAQLELERDYPGATAMFVTGCGGDQNPLPRRTIALCESYGKQLAIAVRESFQKTGRPLQPAIRTAFESVPLAFEKNPTREELKEALNSPNAIRARWAKRMLQQMDQQIPFATSQPYAVQAWRLGDQLWIALGGEALVDYSLRFQSEYGPTTWVTSYFADLTAYIPSRKNWDERGYEVDFLFEYMLPADRWASDVEDRIAASVQRLVAEVSPK